LAAAAAGCDGAAGARALYSAAVGAIGRDGGCAWPRTFLGGGRR